MHPCLNIDSYISEGFVHICDVDVDRLGWRYKNINSEVLYQTHYSWVYFIVVDKKIVKIGETGNLLGAEMSDGQPQANTKNRLGRYRRGDGTDARIRAHLTEEVEQGKVSFWARKCPYGIIETDVSNRRARVKAYIHKQLEGIYLCEIKKKIGSYPLLNLNNR